VHAAWRAGVLIWSRAACFVAYTPPPLLTTLSLHDALPICFDDAPAAHRRTQSHREGTDELHPKLDFVVRLVVVHDERHRDDSHRSEEHTSELQSRENLVCRLLLEKKQPSNQLVFIVGAGGY